MLKNKIEKVNTIGDVKIEILPAITQEIFIKAIFNRYLQILNKKNNKSL